MRKVIILIMTIILVTGCGKEATVKKSKTIKEVKVNKNSEVLKDKEQDGLTFTKTSLSSVNKLWTLETIVSNNTETDYKLNEFKVIFKDKDGNIVTTLIGYVGGVIPKGSKREIKTGTYIDLTDVTNVEYEVVR